MLLGNPLTRPGDLDRDGDEDQDDIILQRNGVALGGGGSVILAFGKLARVSVAASNLAVTVLVGANDDLRPYVVERARLPIGRYVEETARLRHLLQRGSQDAEKDVMERTARRLQELEREFWEPLGESTGVTQTFTARGSQPKARGLILRVRDKSGRAFDRNGEIFDRPGVALRGVGVTVSRQTPPPRGGTTNITGRRSVDVTL